VSRIGKLFIIAAPSGGGKTSLIKALIKEEMGIKMSVSHTTRERRETETDGVDYFYVDKEEFLVLLNADNFLEHATVFGNFYGTSRAWVNEALATGLDVILEIDWQGAQQVRELMPEAVSIFILPPSREVLEERLRSRDEDSLEIIQRRLDESINEMSHYGEYDYLIINEDFNQALADLTAIFLSYRLTVSSQQAEHADIIAGLLQ